MHAENLNLYTHRSIIYKYTLHSIFSSIQSNFTMEAPSLSLLLLSLCLLSFSSTYSHAATIRCNPSDYKVLLQIKQALNNPYHLASWVPNTDCCNWYTLECDPKTNRVYELTIFSGNISGQIPPQVGDLPYLQTLTFRKLTNITGSIPRSITKLTHLRSLRISWLNITGPVPDFLSELKNLTFIELSFNQLSGSIPPSLSKLTNLLSIDLSRNKLTGPIPDSFGHFTGSTPDLYLSHNQLSGAIPKSLGNLDFGRVDFSRNKLTGDASMLFKANGSTQQIDLSRNLLEFDLTNAKFPSTSLNVLDLNHNSIYGSVPKGLISVENLQFFNVSYNSLCGEIPTGGKLQTFDSTSYFHNKCLCGPPLAKC